MGLLHKCPSLSKIAEVGFHGRTFPPIHSTNRVGSIGTLNILKLTSTCFWYVQEQVKTTDSKIRSFGDHLQHCLKMRYSRVIPVFCGENLVMRGAFRQCLQNLCFASHFIYSSQVVQWKAGLEATCHSSAKCIISFMPEAFYF